MMYKDIFAVCNVFGDSVTVRPVPVLHDGFVDACCEAICAGEVWFEPLERIYFNRDSRQPGIAFNVTMYPHTNAIVDMDDELDANQNQRTSYASDSTDDEDVMVYGFARFNHLRKNLMPIKHQQKRRSGS